ncbi:MAG: outer membrane protein assembly factor BamA [Gemmatimonadaceae bacterium]|nr:outer membrane protein assembly factor BamA [Gemmatimonadaceae bacterium]
MPFLRILRVVAVLAAVPVSLSLTATSAEAQDPRCVAPDTIIVSGNRRVDDLTVLEDAAIRSGDAISARTIQAALKNLYSSGQYEDVKISCRLSADGIKAALVIAVKERPILSAVAVRGPSALNEGDVRERVEVLVGRPLDAGLVARSVNRIDSLYRKSGYYLARVAVDSIVNGDRVSLTFTVSEGRRLAVSGIRINGAKNLPAASVVQAMKTKPEGFWFWQNGEFDDELFAGDIAERLPKLYADKGYIDFQVTKDTLIVDPARGKALVELTVNEGPRYKVGRFEVEGNSRFNSSDINLYYPFQVQAPTVGDRVRSLLGKQTPKDAFNQSKWDDATGKLRTAYGNEGYIYAQVRPTIERRGLAEKDPRVDLRWVVEERSPAIVNRVDVQGNDYTVEQCIRDQLVMIPGDVFNQDRLLRSYQSLGNMGLFETPLSPPDTRPANDEGDVDVIFRVKEKRTGNINFGASVGQVVGLGGFIGLDQPNLFGRCKRGSLQWQFGAVINDFNASYTDPAIRQSRISGSVNAYRSVNRFTIAGIGTNRRTGSSFQLGFPVPRSYFTRAFVNYNFEWQEFGSGSNLLGSLQTLCERCFRSTVGTSIQRDTRVDMPFASQGGLQSLSANFSGGVLGGTSTFARYTTELKTYAPLFTFGGSGLGSQPIKLVAGLSVRGGGVFGDPGPFFITQSFAMGGVMFGEPLRGYPEFSITPQGFIPNTSGFSAQQESFGRAYFSSTAEIGLRFNSMFYASAFYDAGNVWRRPQEFDPTRLFRGAGVGVSVISPLGPLGLDYAYGFDRVDAFGQTQGKWQFHFRLGNMAF